MPPPSLPSPPDSWQGMSDMSPVTAGTEILYLYTTGQFILHAFFLYVCGLHYVQLPFSFSSSPKPSILEGMNK